MIRALEADEVTFELTVEQDDLRLRQVTTTKIANARMKSCVASTKVTFGPGRMCAWLPDGSVSRVRILWVGVRTPMRRIFGNQATTSTT